MNSKSLVFNYTHYGFYDGKKLRIIVQDPSVLVDKENLSIRKTYTIKFEGEHNFLESKSCSLSNLSLSSKVTVVAGDSDDLSEFEVNDSGLICLKGESLIKIDDTLNPVQFDYVCSCDYYDIPRVSSSNLLITGQEIYKGNTYITIEVSIGISSNGSGSLAKEVDFDNVEFNDPSMMANLQRLTSSNVEKKKFNIFSTIVNLRLNTLFLIPYLVKHNIKLNNIEFVYSDKNFKLIDCLVIQQNKDDLNKLKELFAYTLCELGINMIGNMVSLPTYSAQAKLNNIFGYSLNDKKAVAFRTLGGGNTFDYAIVKNKPDFMELVYYMFNGDVSSLTEKTFDYADASGDSVNKETRDCLKKLTSVKEINKPKEISKPKKTVKKTNVVANEVVEDDRIKKLIEMKNFTLGKCKLLTNNKESFLMFQLFFLVFHITKAKDEEVAKNEIVDLLYNLSDFKDKNEALANVDFFLNMGLKLLGDSLLQLLSALIRETKEYDKFDKEDEDKYHVDNLSSLLCRYFLVLSQFYDHNNDESVMGIFESMIGKEIYELNNLPSIYDSNDIGSSTEEKKKPGLEKVETVEEKEEKLSTNSEDDEEDEEHIVTDERTKKVVEMRDCVYRTKSVNVDDDLEFFTIEYFFIFIGPMKMEQIDDFQDSMFDFMYDVGDFYNRKTCKAFISDLCQHDMNELRDIVTVSVFKKIYEFRKEDKLTKEEQNKYHVDNRVSLFCRYLLILTEFFTKSNYETISKVLAILFNEDIDALDKLESIYDDDIDRETGEISAKIVEGTKFIEKPEQKNETPIKSSEMNVEADPKEESIKIDSNDVLKEESTINKKIETEDNKEKPKENVSSNDAAQKPKKKTGIILTVIAIIAILVGIIIALFSNVGGGFLKSFDVTLVVDYISEKKTKVINAKVNYNLLTFEPEITKTGFVLSDFYIDSGYLNKVDNTIITEAGTYYAYLKPKATGALSDPYLVYSLDDLSYYRDKYSGQNYKLMSDLEINNQTYFDVFTGNLDGNNHQIIYEMDSGSNEITVNPFIKTINKSAKISNLVFSILTMGTGRCNMLESSCGTFVNDNYGQLSDITFKSKTLTKAKLSNSYSYSTVGICGFFGGSNYGVVENCQVNGDFDFMGYVIPDHKLGCLFGSNSGTITGCKVNASFQSFAISGMVCGQNSGTITNCSTLGKFHFGIVNKVARNYSPRGGGIAGVNLGIITSCKNYANFEICHRDVDEFAATIGGIVGVSFGVVTDCLNKGELINTSFEDNDKNDIDNSVCTFLGGICGSLVNNGTISTCKNEGFVAFDTDGNSSWIGGIVGVSSGGSKINDCYNIAQLSGQTSGGQYETIIGGIASLIEGELINCFNVGSLNKLTNNEVGGVTGGTSEDTWKITNCSYLANCDYGIGQDKLNTGCTSYSSTSLMTMSTMKLSTSYWKQTSSNTYPKLRWES